MKLRNKRPRCGIIRLAAEIKETALSLVAFRPRHFAAHEPVEKWNSESRVAMGGAVDHAFGDERVAHRRNGRYFFAELFCNVAGSVRSRPQLRHGAHIALLGGRQPIEAHMKKTRVQLGERNDCRPPRIDFFDGRGVRDIPTVLAPFLYEIGVALGFPVNRDYRLFREADVSPFGRLA